MSTLSEAEHAAIVAGLEMLLIYVRGARDDRGDAEIYDLLTNLDTVSPITTVELDDLIEDVNYWGVALLDSEEEETEIEL